MRSNPRARIRSVDVQASRDPRLGRAPARWAALWLFLVCAWACPAAQPYVPVVEDPLTEPWRWRTFPELSGLGMQCMAEGADGTLWFGAIEGLWSYDGVKWEFRGVAEGLVGTAALCRAPDGTLYGASNSGIWQLSGRKWTRLLTANPAPWGEVRRLLVTRDGSLWAATRRGALRWSHSTWTWFTTQTVADRLRNPERSRPVVIETLPAAVLQKSRHPAGQPAGYGITDVVEDRDGRLWFATDDGEILSCQPADGRDRGGATDPGWRLYNETDGLVCGRTPAMLALADGQVWVAPAGGAGVLNVFDGHAWKSTRLADLGLPDEIGALYQTRDGVAWASCRYEIYANRGGVWKKYTKPQFPVPAARNALLQSLDGALWIAGPSTEVVRVDYQTASWFTLRGLIFQWEGSDGAEWFIEHGGRVVVRRGNAWTSYGPEDGVIDAPVALIGTRRGEIWVAGSHEHVAATARFDGRAWERAVHHGFSWGIEWRGVMETSDGSVWFSAAVDTALQGENKAGLLQYRDGKWLHHYQPGRMLPGDTEDPAVILPATQRPEPVGKFISIGESRDGKLWAGRNIIICRDQGRWSVFRPPAGLRLGIVESLFTSHDGDLWVGTRQFGALRYDGKGWTHFQGKDSLVANSVLSIAETPDRAIWVATDRDISRYDGLTWSTSQLPGVLNVALEGGSLEASRSGDLWINRFGPDWTRRAHPNAPKTEPTGEFRTVRHRFQGPAPETTIAGGSREVPAPGNVSVFWSGIVPWREGSEATVEFSFRLDDQPWSAFAPDRGHAFFNLESGTHRLQVRARDREFNIDPTPATIDIVVLPPLWRQAWFVVLLAVLAGLVVAQTVRITLERSRLRRSNRILAAEIRDRQRVEEELRKLNLELDQRVTARTAQLQAVNKELEAFSYSVSHDLRAPLRGIDGFSKALLEDYADRLDAEGKDYLLCMRSGAQRMGRLIDDLLRLSRVSREELHLSEVDLSAVAREVGEDLKSREPGRNVDFKVAPDVVVWGDARLLRVALENLLGNAWKFTGKCASPHVEFGARGDDGDALVCFVRDDGAGFDMEYAGRLFQAFRRLHTQDEYPGTGIGLATVNRIIHRHGGRVWAEGRIGLGATIYFALPRRTPDAPAAM